MSRYGFVGAVDDLTPIVDFQLPRVAPLDARPLLGLIAETLPLLVDPFAIDVLEEAAYWIAEVSDALRVERDLRKVLLELANAQHNEIRRLRRLDCRPT